MLNTGRLAAPQYQKIMAQGTDYFKLTIQNYLDARAREDELFAPHEEIRKNSLENEIGVVKTGCFGLCALGPIMIVYPEGAFYSMLKAVSYTHLDVYKRQLKYIRRIFPELIW